MSTVSGTVYVCIKQFNARLGDELNLKVGDKIEVLADDSEYNDGWYMGRNIVTNNVGLFPKSFTKISVESGPKEPGLLRLRLRRVPTGNSLASEKSSGSLVPPALPKHDADVKSTMNEIDKALHELQVSAGSGKSHARSDSVQLLTQDLNPLKAAEWTPKQVLSYFALVLGFDLAIAGKFARHKITGDILFELDLAHLKELDIDSFGTRFEVYKEIEKLKQISSRVKSQSKTSLADTSQDNVSKSEGRTVSPPYNNSDDDKQTVAPPPVVPPPKMNYLQLSKSQSHLLPSVELNGASELNGDRNGKTVRTASSAKNMYMHQRTRSQSAENVLYQSPKDTTLDTMNSTTFMSPRKAPEPPSTSPMNKDFKFGGSPVTPNTNNFVPQNNLYMTRTNASGKLRPASSIYDNSVLSHHRRGSSGVSQSHKRHSSVFLFLSGNHDDGHLGLGNGEKLQSQNLYKNPTTPNQLGASASPLNKRNSKLFKEDLTLNGNDDVHIDDVNLSPKKSKNGLGASAMNEDLASPQGRLKSLRSVSTQNFKSLTGLKKLKTSAFQEGIRDINPDDAIKSSNYSGWLSKRSANAVGWRSRYFTLHGTRLSYFASLKDKREKGLIDITAHKVIPISTDGENAAEKDKFIALFASSTGFGRYCFKLVPPAPGFKKGLTFTQPKTHYFAVETQEEMRGWMKALMTATIDIDDTVPVVSSCNTPTVTLAKAQELLAKAREETKLKDEELRAKGLRGGYAEDSVNSTLYNDSATSEEASPIVGSLDETTILSTTGNTSHGQPKLTVDTQVRYNKSPSTPQASTNSGGFASPYLLASGLLSPKQAGQTPQSSGVSVSTATTPQSTFVYKQDYFDPGHSDLVKPADLEEVNRSEGSIGSPRTERSNSSFKGVSQKKKAGEKLMAYTSDGSFVIKLKKK